MTTQQIYRYKVPEQRQDQEVYGNYRYIGDYLDQEVQEEAEVRRVSRRRVRFDEAKMSRIIQAVQAVTTGVLISLSEASRRTMVKEEEGVGEEAAAGPMWSLSSIVLCAVSMLCCMCMLCMMFTAAVLKLKLLKSRSERKRKEGKKRAMGDSWYEEVTEMALDESSSIEAVNMLDREFK